jgi:hypothetical protein
VNKNPKFPNVKKPPYMKMLENVASFSDGFHTSDKYKAFYDRYSNQLSGFPGIWIMCSFAGYAFGLAERAMRAVGGEDYEWIDAMERYVELVHEKAAAEYVADIQRLDWFFPLAVQAINEKSYDEQEQGKQPETVHGKYAIGAYDNSIKEPDGTEPPMYWERDGNWCAYDNGFQLKEGDLSIFDSADAAEQYWNTSPHKSAEPDELVVVLSFDKGQRPIVEKELHRGAKYKE